MQLLIIVIGWVLIGWACSMVADKRGRDPISWFYLGVIGGLIALLALYILPVHEKKVRTPEKTEEPSPFVDQCWYYLNPDHKQVGPVPLTQIQALWKSGVLSAESYVWSEGMEEWGQIRTLTPLCQTLKEQE